MSADPIIVAILIVLGSICGLLLSIVPRLVDRLGPLMGGRAVRALNATSVGAYIAIGWWVHYQRGVSYPRERAIYMQELAADELCKYCTAPADGRQAWLLFWIVAGLVAYALRPAGRHRVLARRSVGAGLSLLGVGVIWLFIWIGQSHEVPALLFAGGFFAAGMAVAGTPLRRRRPA